MGLSRLRGIDPGRVAIWQSSLSMQPAAVQREAARAIERAGFRMLWYGESTGREAFGQAAIYLGATERLILGSGIANIWARDAAAMANGGRTLSEAWPGRFVLGIGVSHAPMVDARGHHYERPLATMREYLDAMEQAQWRGPAAELPPIVLAALGPKMVELARDRTAGAYPYFTTDEHIRAVRDGLGPEPFLGADLPVILATDRAEARAIGRSHMERYLGVANYRNHLLRLGWSEADLEPPGSDALFDAVLAWGDRATVALRIRARLDAGADQVILNPITPALERTYVDDLATLATAAREATG